MDAAVPVIGGSIRDRPRGRPDDPQVGRYCRVIEDLSLVGAPFLLGLAAVALVAVVVAVHWTPRRLGRRVLAFVAGVLVLATVSAGINGHFAYVRTVGQVFGQMSGNVVSSADLDRSCDEAPSEGSITSHDIPGARSGFDAQPAWLYFPPAWCLGDHHDYPVVVLLHGIPGTTKDWINSGLANQTADAFAARHDGRAPVLVMPDTGGSDDTECVDSARYGNVETYLTEDVPTFVDDRYGDRLADAPDGWAVAGLSMGGTCALMLTLRHPDLFHTFGDYSGETFGVGTRDETVRTLFDGDERAYDRHDPSQLMTPSLVRDLGGWFQVGGDDGAAESDTVAYQRDASDAGMATCLVVVPGEGHTFVLWAKAFEQSLPWMAARTGLIEPSPAQRAACENR